MITRQVQEQYTESEDSPWILERVMTISKKRSLSASIATSIAIWQKNADSRRKNEKHELVSNVTRRGILPKTVKEHSQWRNKRFRRNQTIKMTIRKRRVLAMISSRHSTRDLPCKFPE